MQSRKFGKDYVPLGALLAGVCAVVFVMFVMTMVSVIIYAVHLMK